MAIHDFLPRHRAGSEIYAWRLARALAARHHVTILCAEYDPGRAHGAVTWRLFDDLPVVELNNTWAFPRFEESYASAALGQILEHVLRATAPDVLHVHNLLNLSFELPALARARGVPTVATLHDYTLVCPSGGQRVHVAERHVCATIDTARCARCFRQSPFASQMGFARVANGRAGGPLATLARAARRIAPRVLAAAIGGVAHAAPQLDARDIEARLARARRVFTDVALWVAPSPALGEEYVRLGLPRERLRVSDYGFAADGFAAARAGRRPRPSGAPLVVGFAGTLVWHKGVHLLLEAARQLPTDRLEVRIFGDLETFPAYAADLRALATASTRFMGGFTPERAAEAYAGLDVLVVPSLWPENSPLVVHEAFMAGVPVVAARMGGLVDLVADGVSGLLYEATSPAALAAALRRLLEEPNLLPRLAAAVPAVKSIEDDAREWDEVYRQVVAR